MKRYFITGTDTEIGKTWVASALVRLLVSQGNRVAAMKPLASGCERTHGGLRNEDALTLMAASNVSLPYEHVNPYAYEPAIAPHIAAEHTGMLPDIGHIKNLSDQVDADVLIVEGVGGWCVPVNHSQLLPELVSALGCDVILVVGMRLGCINHAILSANQIQRDGFNLVGWVANQVDPEMSNYTENMTTLSKMLDIPLLCEVSWRGNIEAISRNLA